MKKEGRRFCALWSKQPILRFYTEGLYYSGWRICCAVALVLCMYVEPELTTTVAILQNSSGSQTKILFCQTNSGLDLR